MYKSELRKLRALPATKEMIEKGKKYEERTVRYYLEEKQVIEPEYYLLARVQNLKGYIKIALFLPAWIRKNIRTPRYEIFVNTEGNEWITRELDEDGKEKKWSKAMFFNLDGVGASAYYARKRIFLNNDGMNTLNKLEISSCLGEKGLWRLQRWQQEQREKRIEEREAREQAPWDKDMALIPKLPNTFVDWMRRNTAKTSCRQPGLRFRRRMPEQFFCDLFLC